jgi:uncharacterized phiE125 gp8 family phage protein
MLKLIERSPLQPVSLEEMVDHLRRQDTEEDDPYIERSIKAATLWAENYTGLALVDQTWDYYFDEFPDITRSDGRFIAIPKPPLIDVEGVFYRYGVEGAFTDYYVDYASHPGRIFIGTSTSWPTTDGALHSGRIRFRAGYVDESGSPPIQGEVPEDIKAAIQIYAGTLYTYREFFSMGTAQTAPAAPWGAESLLRQYRVETSIA